MRVRDTSSQCVLNRESVPAHHAHPHRAERVALVAGLVGLTLATSLVGCATYVATPLVPESTMEAFQARSLDSAGVHGYVASHLDAGGPPASTVWDVETLTLAAFYFSPALDLARAKAATATAAVQTASQRPNPVLQLPFEYTTNPLPGESPYTLGLGLDIPIETAYKRGYRIAEARQLSLAAQFEVGDAAWQVRSRLRGQLLDLFDAQRRSKLLQNQLQARERIVQMTEKRLEVGEVSAPQVHQARSALVQGQLDLAKTNEQASDALAGAAQAIGIPERALENADIHLAAFLEPPLDVPEDASRKAALLNRADLLASLASYEASQAALQLEVANQYPDIHLGPGYTFDAGARKIGLPLSGIALPLFNQNQGKIAEAVARRQEAAARYNLAQAQAISHADRAAAHYRAATAAYRLAETLRANEERQLDAVRTKFEAGETDRLALALAEVEADSAALAWEDSLTQVQRSIGELEDATQHPLSLSTFTAH